MKKELAEKLVSAAGVIDGILASLPHAIDEGAIDAEERRALHRAWAELTSHVHEKLRIRALNDYPEFDPDKGTDFPFVKGRF